MQRGQLAEVGIGHEDVERLALVDVRAAVGSHVDQVALLDLPDRLVQRLELLGDVQVEHAAVCGDLRERGRDATRRVAVRVACRRALQRARSS